MGNGAKPPPVRKRRGGTASYPERCRAARGEADAALVEAMKAVPQASTEWSRDGMRFGQIAAATTGQRATGRAARRRRSGRDRIADCVVRIAIAKAAYDAIYATLPLGSGAVEPHINKRGDRHVWLEAAMADRVGAMRGRGSPTATSPQAGRTGRLDEAHRRTFVGEFPSDVVLPGYCRFGGSSISYVQSNAAAATR